MVKRYSNFHRARKYFRKLLGARRIEMGSDRYYRYAELSDKYSRKAFHRDGIATDSTGEYPNLILIIVADVVSAPTRLEYEIHPVT